MGEPTIPSPLLGKEYPSSSRYQAKSIYLTRDGSIYLTAIDLKAEMCRLLLKHYDWEKEIVPALAMVVERTGYVKLEGQQLEVTLRRFANREIDYAARRLCEDLNRMQPVTLDKFHLSVHYRLE